jgi:cell division protein FtsI (penicillin-binding protein 3)
MNSQIGKWVKIRILIILALFYGLAVTILARAYQFQVLEADKLSRRAEQQHRHLERIMPRRGVIYDSARRELAVSKESYSVFSRPDQVLNLADTAQRLAKALGMSSREIRQTLASPDPFVWVIRQTDPESAERVRLLKLPGVGTVPESRRYYPGGSLAAHVLGFAGVDSQGLEGIEHAYDGMLRGEARYLITERDARGESIFLPGSGWEQESRGTDLILTLDKSLQFIAERELKQAVAQNRAKGGSVVAMDPRTGRILILAVEPGFDPNSFSRFNPAVYRNRAVTDAFEPGSIFKVFIAAAVIEENVAHAHDVFFCENGAYTIADKVISDLEPHGWLTLRQVIAYSSNVGASKLGQRLGKERLHDYITRFGFGSRTGIDFPGESKGIVAPPRSWSPVGVGTIAFGQGVAVTALQIVTAISAVANGGILMKPYLVEKAVRPDGTEVVLHQPERVARVLSPKTVKEVVSIMESVVQGDGTGQRAAIEGYRVAGKTGTAQKAKPGARGYEPGKYTCSFLGFVPANDPRLAMIVVIDEPQTDYASGGRLAAPVFREIARQAMVQLKVPRAGEGGPAIARREGAPEEAEGIREELTTADRELLSKAQTAGQVMPDLSGQTIRQALKQLADLGLPVQVQGSGRAVGQEPLPGASLADCSEVVVRFQP